MKRILRCCAYIVFALLLLPPAILLTANRLLTPEAVGRLLARQADEWLDARVSMGQVRLSAVERLPYLSVSVDSLYLLPDNVRRLPDSVRRSLPQYADTLLSCNGFSAQVNMLGLLRGRVELGDIRIVSPQFNIVDINATTGNYQILRRHTPAGRGVHTPRISLRNLRIVSPQPIRYCNVPDGTEVTLDLRSLELEQLSPRVYGLSAYGTVPLPKFAHGILKRIPVSLNGHLLWSGALPGTLGADNLRFDLAFLSGTVNGSVSLSDSTVIRRLDVQLDPLDIGPLLELMPAAALQSLGLPSDLSTDLRPRFSLHLDSPYPTGSGAMPKATLRLQTAPGYLVCDGTRFTDCSADIAASLGGTDLTDMLIRIRRLQLNLPGVSLDVSGLVSDPLVDPRFDGNLNLVGELGRLPRAVLRHIPGRLSGSVDARLRLSGRLAALTPARFEGLQVSGRVDADGLRWLDPAGHNMLAVTHARLRPDSILPGGLVLTVDSARMRHTKYDFGIAGMTLHLPRLPRSFRQAIDGELELSRFRFTLLHGGLEITARQLAGPVRWGAGRLADSLPAYSTRLTAQGIRIAAPHSIVTTLGLTRLHWAAAMLPDSLAVKTPGWHYYRAPGHRHRTYMAYRPDGSAYVHWGISPQFHNLLTKWRVQADVSSDAPGSLTGLPTGRMGIARVDVAATNQGAELKAIDMNLDHSRLHLSGFVTNLTEALIDSVQPLRADLGLRTDSLQLEDVLALISPAPRGRKPRQALLLPDNVQAGIQLASLHGAFAGLPLQNVSATVTLDSSAVRVSRFAARSRVGTLTLDGRYSAPDSTRLALGWKLGLKGFDVHDCLQLLPRLRRMIPLTGDMSGMIDAQFDADIPLEPDMRPDTLATRARMHVTADSLNLTHNERYDRIRHWLLLHSAEHHPIRSLSVNAALRDGVLTVPTFTLHMGPYRLQLGGKSTLAGYYDYTLHLRHLPLWLHISGPPPRLRL